MNLTSLIPFGRSASTSGQVEDPFVSLRRQMDRLLEDFTRGFPTPAVFGNAQGAFIAPRVDIAETPTGIELKAELPGVEPGDIQLDVADGVLTLKAERKSEREEKDEAKQYHLVERASGTFLRRFALPFEPDMEKVSASFDKGVLSVVVPRSPSTEKPQRRIEVKTG